MTVISQALGLSVVGPSTAYWETFPQFGEGYAWRFGYVGTTLEYPILFKHGGRDAHRDKGDPVLVAGLGARVVRLSDEKILVWGPRRREDDLLVETFALSELSVIADLSHADADPWTAAATPLDHLTIPHRLPAGRAPVQYVSHAASGMSEILLLAPGPSRTEAATSIYVWQPGEGTIDVIPLAWYGARTHDMGYEWIARVARDPASGHFIGDGVRISPFELDANGRWLRTLPSVHLYKQTPRPRSDD